MGRCVSENVCVNVWMCECVNMCPEERKLLDSNGTKHLVSGWGCFSGETYAALVSLVLLENFDFDQGVQSAHCHLNKTLQRIVKKLWSDSSVLCGPLGSCDSSIPTVRFTLVLRREKECNRKRQCVKHEPALIFRPQVGSRLCKSCTKKSEEFRFVRLRTSTASDKVGGKTRTVHSTLHAICQLLVINWAAKPVL